MNQVFQNSLFLENQSEREFQTWEVLAAYYGLNVLQFQYVICVLGSAGIHFALMVLVGLNWAQIGSTGLK